MHVEAIEERQTATRSRGYEADGRLLPIRFTFDEGKIARVEVL